MYRIFQGVAFEPEGGTYCSGVACHHKGTGAHVDRT